METYMNEIRDLEQAVASINNAIEHIHPDDFGYDVDELLGDMLKDLRSQRTKIRIIISKVSALQEEE